MVATAAMAVPVIPKVWVAAAVPLAITTPRAVLIDQAMAVAAWEVLFQALAVPITMNPTVHPILTTT